MEEGGRRRVRERCNPADSEHGGRAHEAWNVGSLRELEKAKEQMLPHSLRGEHNSADPLILAW